ncbi:hypothetical protein FPCIR_11717 [Fusarium pseudocircinatum]|uniref:2EXR domain-containing protein n=1 Tax=Fusarium pseudocircinatum TaxID=56676 RepID=A0A8H5NWD2_9HYPO|nr:hypothetical protein FPCIR_11717 [Fusarium pseudocircinatum]
MALTEFHCFSLLPVELRREIYSLATAPRFVHVQLFDEQDYDEFAEHLRNTPNAIRLDESLIHFSFNWRSQIPAQTKQHTLERYGFSSTKLAYQPWKATKLAPQMSLDWLSEHPEHAWQLCREVSMYSTAPIPALLHTCRESRDVLIQKGYQLAFRTRSHDPRTWFNFDHDVLFISHGDDWGTKHRIVSGCTWDIGQFHPDDMQKVKRVALEESTGSLYLAHPRFSEGNYKFSDLSSVLRLFKHIEELLLVEWTDSHIVSFCPMKDFYDRPKQRHRYDTQGLWSYQPVSEVDVLPQLFPPTKSWSPLIVASIGPYGELLNNHQGLTRNGYFKMVLESLEEKLVKYRSSVASRHSADANAWWNTPTITTVHAMSNWGHELLAREREAALSQVYKLRKKWLAHEKRCSNRLTEREGDGFEAEEEAYNLVSDPYKAQRTWWIREGIIPFLAD